MITGLSERQLKEKIRSCNCFLDIEALTNEEIKSTLEDRKFWEDQLSILERVIYGS